MLQIKPTPTPLPPAQPNAGGAWAPPAFSIWQFTDWALQTWTIAGTWTYVIQVLFILVIVLFGLSLVLRKLRATTNEEPEAEE